MVMTSMFVLFVFASVLLVSCQQEKEKEGNESGTGQHLLLTNEKAGLIIDQYGGAYISFYLKKDSVNPLTWSLMSEQMPPNNRDGAPFQGHFLCLGRWGAPTPGEMEMGVPYNGEATNSMWSVQDKTVDQVVMGYKSSLDDMEIIREAELLGEEAVFFVKEQIRNTNTVARLNNVVQHVTIGPPFLSDATRLFSNAGPGFFQDHSYPDPHRWEYMWPMAKDSLGNSYNLQRSDMDYNYVSTHLIEDSVGWITAWASELRLLLGYVWYKTDYPWLNVWHHTEDGKPVAKGLEFGTTGIGKPYQDLLATDTRFHGSTSFEFLDAGELVEKTFYGFLVSLDEELIEIQHVSLSDGLIKMDYEVTTGVKSENWRW